MTQQELDEIKQICEEIHKEANDDLRNAGNERDIQYHIGRKHSAKDIIYKLNQIKVEESKKNNQWSVTVELNHQQLIRIETNGMSDKKELTKENESVIRMCAEHLLGFVGNGEL